MIRNTLLYNLVFITLGTVLAVAVAIILNEIRSKKAKQLYQTVILIPLFDFHGYRQLSGICIPEHQ